MAGFFGVVMSAQANDEIPGQFEYDGINYVGLTETTVAVDEGYYDGDIVIPEEVEYDGNTYIVTEIGERAFEYTDVYTVELPSTLEKIGDWAFLDCWNLTEIHIPDSVTWIGFYAFGCCYDLEEVTLPANLTVLEEEVFRDDYSLTSIYIPDTVTEIREDAFYGCDGLEEVNMPANLRVLGEYAFSECSSLTEVIFPEGLEELGYSAFQRCTALETVIFPSTLRVITAAAFYSCNSLEEITIPASVEEIGGSAFGYCSNLMSVTSEGVVPPVLAKKACFSDATYADAVLTVPVGAKDAYAADEFWGLFENIQESSVVGVGQVTIPEEEVLIYTLDGKKVKDTDSLKGIYIRNGKKIQL